MSPANQLPKLRQTPTKAQTSPRSSPRPDYVDLPRLTSSPSPQKKFTQQVIPASDEEDLDAGDSDSDMEDLLARFDPRKTAPMETSSAAPRRIFETPKAKRHMTDQFYSSPLTIQSKHAFDMKALAEDAESDKRVEESSRRHEEELAEAAEIARELAAAKRVDGNDQAFLSVVHDRGGSNAHKVLRAVQRAESGHGDARFCFFKDPYSPPAPDPVPKKMCTGPWRGFAGSASAREQYLVSGIPYTVLQKCGGLADELFDWMLSQICGSRSRLMQIEYLNLVTMCSDQIETRITPDRLRDLFNLIGSREDITSSTQDELQTNAADEETYREKDWGSVRMFLQLLAVLAPHMAVESVKYALSMLLTMAADDVILRNVEILVEHEDAVIALLAALPLPSWDGFCLDTTKRLYHNFKSQHVRIKVLMCLPISDARSHELRRRLATAFLFDDPSLGGENPEVTVTLRKMIARLDGPDFVINALTKTDWDELRANVLLLDMAIDDGSRSWAAAGLVDEKQFNAEVDQLADKLRETWRRINDSGMKIARTDAKSVLDWVGQRIQHQVRTKAKPKKNMFDEFLKEPKPDPDLPKQQDYMKHFLGKPIG
ncbi:uncharacterized protein F5Z01DRAFT_630309 [Emericellopsis atlantica]|uniref:Uncharacterized protein n=1 Tax=Emericellopsis atlantica TaxID=2614577 RepID=A0A9P7ZDK9_9HYPO|nr:uncharacterized protein F5Z01DRAFT_630309 [Emericellopsis atlantica]KAG9250119.1 hypothetical protein F5Z01DRAFT_630309 [Emericellopsis atlantica]